MIYVFCGIAFVLGFFFKWFLIPKHLGHHHHFKKRPDMVKGIFQSELKNDVLGMGWSGMTPDERRKKMKEVGYRLFDIEFKPVIRDKDLEGVDFGDD